MNINNHITLVGTVDSTPTYIEKNNRSESTMTMKIAGVHKVGEPTKFDYIPIIARGKLAEVISGYLKKGERVLVDGKLHIRKTKEVVQDKPIWVTEVIADNIKFLTQDET